MKEASEPRENVAGARAGTRAPSRWAELWQKEDYWAIWLGVLLLATGLLIFLPRRPEGLEGQIAAANATLERESAAAPFKTIAWYRSSDQKEIKATSQGFAKKIQNFLSKPHGWSENPLEAFVLTGEKAAAKKAAAEGKYASARQRTGELLAAAQGAEAAARAAAFEDRELNEAAVKAIGEWRHAKAGEGSAKKKAAVKPYNQVGSLVGLGVAFAILFGIGIFFMGWSPVKFLIGFGFVYLVAVLAYLFAGQAQVKAYGIGYAFWAILFGMLISNTVGTPKWAMPAVQTEYFIKTGLVLLGAEILFGKILTIGIPGIFVAWVVTPIVLIGTYIFGQRVLRIASRTLNITISADMSVCGVSAAIATAAACRAKKEELTLAVGLSLIFTSIMMILMPAVILSVGMPHVLGGAWMGGTIDATGAVAAAGAFLGDRALYVAATIKMIQNVLIGVIAFFVAFYWTVRIERTPGATVSKMEIWYRFPKFVLGFIGVSIVFSLVYQSLGPDVGYTMIDNGVIGGFSAALRGWFFCLAFVSIGLATNFRELRHYFKGGKPLILYVCGQSFNLCLTLLMAYLMFYVVFPGITERI